MITFEPIKRKILIVDDDPEILKLISVAVSLALKEKGYDVITADNGRKAIEIIKAAPPDIVTLDLNLPDINGKEILKKIKEIDEDIAVIVITGHGGEKVAIDLMKSGAFDFISKPFEIEVLLNSINDALTLRDSRIEDRRNRESSSVENIFPFLAHELRNPLHSIAGAIAVIQRRMDLRDEILSRSVKIIHEEVQHLTGFVQDCLDFVRHPTSGYFVEGQMNEVILNVMDVIGCMFEDLSKKIKIIYRLDPQLPTTRFNYEEIRRVFLNIVKNSFESMPGGGELVIETAVKAQSPEKFIVIAFSDSGSGIRREDSKNLFVPFFTTKLRGSGLGLAICHRIIVERHNGKIDIESQEKSGTRVIVELPIYSARKESP